MSTETVCQVIGFEAWNSDIRIKRETVAAEEILRNLVKIFRLRVPRCIWHRPDLG